MGRRLPPDTDVRDSLRSAVELLRTLDDLQGPSPAATWQRLEVAGERLQERSRRLARALTRQKRSLTAIELLARANRATGPKRVEDTDTKPAGVAAKATPRLSLVR